MVATYEEFYKLTPREIRKHAGHLPIIRIIKYMNEGQSKHRQEAFKTLNHWLRKYKWQPNQLKELCYPIPFMLNNFRNEKNQIRTEICISLFCYMREQKVYFDHEIINILKQLLIEESKVDIKDRLEGIVNWNEFFFKSSPAYNFSQYHFCLTDKQSTNNHVICVTDIQILNIQESPHYIAPIPFKPKKTKRASKDAISCVYFLKEDASGTIKIGKTNNLKTKVFFPYKMPFRYELVHTIESDDVDSLERFFHKHFQNKNVNGEWFSLDEKDWEYIKDFKQLSSIH
ncbi:GIY-YIG nuclease family protein [Priestia filamentosa]|uniref:GIY-YIG nuclease family protein n=1 Tax=Priestia filamentosa TaxID=1402861 RepID=UPI0039822A36